MNALVIDDSPTVRRVLRGYLAALGFETVEASDGVDGLAKLAALPSVDLVVVDWNMPNLDGLSFIRTVRADPGYDAVPLVMVTTEAEVARVAEALAAGAGEYVMKPFTEEMLREKLAILGIGAA